MKKEQQGGSEMHEETKKHEELEEERVLIIKARGLYTGAEVFLKGNLEKTYKIVKIEPIYKLVVLDDGNNYEPKDVWLDTPENRKGCQMAIGEKLDEYAKYGVDVGLNPPR